MSTVNVSEWGALEVENEDSLAIGELGLLLFGHAAFQYLNAGCELGVFELSSDSHGVTKREIAGRLKLQAQPTRCLMFGLTALKLVVKSGDTYRNSSAIEKFFDDGNGRNVQGVSGVGLERTNTALAKDDIVVPAREDVFGREQ